MAIEKDLSRAGRENEGIYSICISTAMRGFPEPTAVWVNDHIVSLLVHTGAEIRHTNLHVCTGFKLIS